MLYKDISKQENVNPEVSLLVAGTFVQANSNPLYLMSTSMSYVQPDGKKL
jgi:hypothetical protein